MENHYLKCEAVICAEDPNPNYQDEVIWFAGEKVCKKGPYKKFQQKQVDINKWLEEGTFRKSEEPYTAYQLEHRSI